MCRPVFKPPVYRLESGTRKALPHSHVRFQHAGSAASQPKDHRFENSNEGLGSETGRFCHLGRPADLLFLVFLATPLAASPRVRRFSMLEATRHLSLYPHQEMIGSAVEGREISTSEYQDLGDNFHRAWTPSPPFCEEFVHASDRVRQHPTWFFFDVIQYL